MEKVSIVVAVYNAEKTLRKCVDSLLSQTYENIEIILVNDCSSDKSLNICNEYSIENNNVISESNKKNSGVSYTRNHGIDISTGKYICFVDSDDYVEDNYIDKLYSALIEYNVKISICGSTYHNMINNTQQHFLWNDSSNVELISMAQGFNLYNKLYLNALWNKLFLTDLIKTKGILFDTNLSMGEDIKFTLDYIEKNNITELAVISQPLYHYFRWNDNSLMSRYFEQSETECLASLKQLYNIVRPLNNSADSLYSIAVENQKKSFKYNAIRSSYSRKEKYEIIKKIYPDYSITDYIFDNIKKIKEKVVLFIHR